MSEIEEVPPYEEWTTVELKAELKSRGLNHAGAVKTLVNRLYADDESAEDAPVSSAPEDEDPVVGIDTSSWVDKVTFYKIFDVDLSGRNVLGIPSDIEHDNFRQEVYNLAVDAGYTPIGGWTNSGLEFSYIIPGYVRLTYKISVRE